MRWVWDMEAVKVLEKNVEYVRKVEFGKLVYVVFSACLVPPLALFRAAP